MIGRERIEVLLEAKSTDEVLGYLREYGIEPVIDAESGKFLREETLLSVLQQAYAAVEDMLPNDAALKLWRYPYDCNNIKAAIKGFVRRIDPRSMMFDFGTVEIERLLQMVQTGNYDGLPTAMCRAAQEATALYAKTKNPQTIDLLLDRACYADMLSTAMHSGSGSAVTLVRQKIDLTNLLITVRILRMKSGEVGKILLNDALLEGGEIATAQIKEWFAAGEESLWDRLYYSQYSALASAVAAGDGGLTAVERCVDNYWMQEIRKIRFVPFGAEVAIAFLLAHEYEVRNLRIILGGKEVGLNTETIRERIRDSYV